MVGHDEVVDGHGVGGVAGLAGGDVEVHASISDAGEMAVDRAV